MIDAKTAHFIEANHLFDPLRLALGKAPEGVCLRQAVEQIAGWQRARKKLPTWAATKGVLFPPHLNIEQCSSESAARYKREIVERLLKSENVGLETYAPSHRPMKWGKMVDLTAGYGVDFTLLSPLFERADYVERDAALCELARHNLPLLGAGHACVVCGSAEEYLEALAEPVDLIFMDPARRDDNGRRTYAIADCRPDILTLLPQILAKTRHFIVKLSPMLDHREAVRQLGAAVSEVHIVATGGEVRETLVVMSVNAEGRPEVTVTCWTDGRAFTAPLGDSTSPAPLYAGTAAALVGCLLFEPDAAVMKSGCFAALCQRYNLRMLAPNSHLFVAESGEVNGKEMEVAPGRWHSVRRTAGLSRRELRKALEGVAAADVAVRNFPLTAVQLRSRLGAVTELGEGGLWRVVGTTVGRERAVIVAERLAQPRNTLVSNALQEA